MPRIHHVITGTGSPPLIFVHGFACAHADWAAQVAHFAPRHLTIAVDLRGHGATPGSLTDASIERHGADVAELLREKNLPPAILIGHSMGCRVVVEAALQAPAHTAGLVLVDGSQFVPAMGPALKRMFATPAGFATVTGTWFKDMFTATSDPAMVASVVARAGRMDRAFGEALLLDLHRYDITRLTCSLASLRVPVLAMQSTTSNEKRERTSLRLGQTSPYLDMLRAAVPSAAIEIIPETGHFPQLDAAARTNMLLGNFLATLPAG